MKWKTGGCTNTNLGRGATTTRAAAEAVAAAAAVVDFFQPYKYEKKEKKRVTSHGMAPRFEKPDQKDVTPPSPLSPSIYQFANGWIEWAAQGEEPLPRLSPLAPPNDTCAHVVCMRTCAHRQEQDSGGSPVAPQPPLPSPSRTAEGDETRLVDRRGRVSVRIRGGEKILN